MKKWLRKMIYSLLMNIRGKAGKANILRNKKYIKTMEPFYNLHTTLNNGKELSFADLKGKKVLIVNTASACGYTPQYDELEKLYEEYKDKVVILGFPANDFGAQEQGSDEEIAQFCKVNYGVTFPIAKKSTVVKQAGQNPVYAWLTNSKLNGWNDTQPNWNFCKYLIDENGELEAFYESAVSPLDEEITGALK